MKNYWIITYVMYLLITLPTMIWVARTLHKHGRIFLVEAFSGKESLADSVNHLLVVGFYLVNFGFITLYMKTSVPLTSARVAVEETFLKVGIAILVLGAMHFFNIMMFNKMRKSPVAKNELPPPPAFQQPQC